ncbi:MAG: DUF2760 domain-containing protein [Planctomycetaceae bacterium]|nr:MAG: DUF2760 domain-containing protein [Planctomycetaceae bacterium]
MLTLSIAVAFRAFFAALFDARRSEVIRRALDAGDVTNDVGVPESARIPSSATPQPPTTTPPRSEALTLLAMLQREARLVDLIQESLDQYSDAQIGAAARPCLTQCRATLARAVDLRPVVDQAEGESAEIPNSASPLRFQWVGDPPSGSTQGAASRTGRVVHPGWQAGRCELAQWTGPAEDRTVIAPAQVEG